MVGSRFQPVQRVLTPGITSIALLWTKPAMPPGCQVCTEHRLHVVPMQKRWVAAFQE